LWLQFARRVLARRGDGGLHWWDAFCGGLSVSVALSAVGPGLSSDANAALVALYRAVIAGWEPPATLTEAEYAAARQLPDTDPLKAFAGFGCSFGAKWFGGYARGGGGGDKTRNFADESRRTLLDDLGAIVVAGGDVQHVDFLDVEPEPTDLVLYLDPPYRGTEEYGGTATFDHARFYARVAAWSRFTDVFVSEYAMPTGVPVLEFAHVLSVTKAESRRATVERLYHYHPGSPLA
jgi:DNA adenine methylase